MIALKPCSVARRACRAWFHFPLPKVRGVAFRLAVPDSRYYGAVICRPGNMADAIRHVSMDSTKAAPQASIQPCDSGVIFTSSYPAKFNRKQIGQGDGLPGVMLAGYGETGGGGGAVG